MLHNVIKSILKSYQKTHRKLNFCFVSNQEIGNYKNQDIMLKFGALFPKMLIFQTKKNYYCDFPKLHLKAL